MRKRRKLSASRQLRNVYAASSDLRMFDSSFHAHKFACALPTIPSFAVILDGAVRIFSAVGASEASRAQSLALRAIALWCDW